MNTEKLKKHYDWVKMWSGKCSVNSGTKMGEMWTSNKILISEKPIYLSPVVFVVRKGITDCWATQADRDDLGKRLAILARKDLSSIKKLADVYKNKSEHVLSFISKNITEKINTKIYQGFWDVLTEYYQPHISVKYTADYLSPTELEKYLPVLQEARKSAEPVFKEQERFIEENASKIAKDANLTKDEILCLTKDEIVAYLDEQLLPDKAVLEKREKFSVIIFENGNFDLFSGEKAVEEVEKIIIPKSNQVRGSIAYKGKCIGKVRIVQHPKTYTGEFENGDILVTGMTRPEFLPFLEKAAAFVTDSGGALSHAAISAREMKKPCIVGTGNATKIFRDGDVVEVDADNGIVKYLRQKTS